MKIYSVSKGEYSDYTVLALYTDKKNAEALCEIQNRGTSYGKAFVEEFDLDEHLELLRDGLSVYFLRMKKDGTAHDISLWGDVNDIDTHGFDVRGDLYAYVAAKDERHAIKIVNEKRVQLIANNKWEGK